MNIGRHQTNERMSKVVVHNNVAYLCGQVAADADAVDFLSRNPPSVGK